jgi:CheY-like chemotaxis protein
MMRRSVHIGIARNENSWSSRVAERQLTLLEHPPIRTRPWQGNHIAAKSEMDRRDGRRDWIVLVADDSADVRTLWSRLLRSVGFRVAEVENGAEAVRVATHLRPHLLMFDIEMPRLDGIAALRRIRRVHRRVPAVAVTGRPELCQHAREFDAVLPKDVDPTELLRHIRRLLGESVRGSKASPLDTITWWFRARKRLLFAALVIWLVVAFRHLYQPQSTELSAETLR